MATFDVLGPFLIPTIARRAGGRTVNLDRQALEAFWTEAECRDRPGCYVFGIRNRGLIPWYAGRTYGRFGGECFQPHKIVKYNEVLADVRRGAPVMFFLPIVRTRGRVNQTAIDSLEDTIIKLGLERNAGMRNISGTRRDEIHVRGVWGARGRGRVHDAARDFKSMFAL